MLHTVSGKHVLVTVSIVEMVTGGVLGKLNGALWNPSGSHTIRQASTRFANRLPASQRRL